jgi:pSer/pThr/pTyr-binding forkhead associated (FHA) protein
VLSHKSISREHCIIGLANDELLVTDLNSTNGTYVDDVRISRATILPVGSVLRLGEISLRHAVHSGEDEGRSGATKPGGFQAGRFAAA